MQPSPTMQRVITALLEKHGLSIGKPEMILKLTMGVGIMPLVIETPLPDAVSVTHYYRQNGDTIADPDVLFVVRPDGWVPMEMQDAWGYRNYVNDPAGQRRLASFAEAWAENIEAQGWLERGRVETARPGVDWNIEQAA